ncbi:hypothetical protein ACNFIC_02720 [Pseudomonas sp. NY15463]|uniref:hypothetical protein n=1 Tax=Pseudomonas sp. NY15463 TaxID=3400361 RepID=UPI003A88DD23
MKRIAVPVALITTVLSGCGEPSEESKAAMQEIRMQRMAREFVSSGLKDPENAQFRNQRGMCGEVNSKNSFGAFTGFQGFIAGSKELVVLQRDSRLKPEEFSQLWSKFCSG